MSGFFPFQPKRSEKVPASPAVIQALCVILNALFEDPLIVKKEDPTKEKAIRLTNKQRCRSTSFLGARCTKILGHVPAVHRNGHFSWEAKTKKKSRGLKSPRPAQRRTKPKPKKKSPSRKAHR